MIDVAFDSGFQTLSNFYKIFKKYVKCTPKFYQKNHQTTLPLILIFLKYNLY